MYTKEDRTLANDRFRACIKAEVTDLRLRMAELQTKVDLYEKYISYCTDHDSIELGEVCSFNGELYRMVSREDKQDTDSAKTVCCEFRCTTPLTKDFKKQKENCDV